MPLLVPGLILPSVCHKPFGTSLLPTDIAGLLMWFCADTVTSAANAVSQVTDKTATVAHLVQATGANQPTLVPTGLNGRPSLLFSANQWVYKGDVTAFGGTGALTVVSVYKLTNNSVGGARVLAFGKNGQVDGTVDSYVPSRRNASQASVGGITTTGFTTYNSISYDTWGIQSGWRDASSINSLWNGQDLKTTALADALSNALVRVCLGTGLGGGGPNTSYLDGQWAESVIYNSALSTLNRQKIEGYLAHKYNLNTLLPSDHPYRYVAP